MIIIDIHANESPTLPDILSHGLTECFGIVCQPVKASSISAFTSLTIAGMLKKQTVSAIVCQRRKDLLGALDANKLIKKDNTPPKVIYVPQTETELGEKLTKSTLAALNAIVVPTPNDIERYASVAQKVTVIEPTYNIEKPIQQQKTEKSKITVSWIGPITEYHRLEKLIEATPKGININVYGTGEARYIMPIVKAARYMPELNITWYGDEYTLSDAISATDIAVKTTRIPNPIQTQMHAMGIPVIDTSDSKETQRLLSDIQQNSDTLFKISEDSSRYYIDHLHPRFHVEQWYNLLTTLRN